jgi:hypothetical protein
MASLFRSQFHFLEIILAIISDAEFRQPSAREAPFYGLFGDSKKAEDRI